MGRVLASSIAMGEEKHGLEEQQRWHWDAREGMVGGSQAKGRQSIRKDSEDTGKAKCL